MRLAELDVQVITEPTVRLDLEGVRRSLHETVANLRPRLLVLDPFVRLHRIDENASGEVAPLLAYLRDLQRRHAVAVLIVHHAKKTSGSVRAGQALRGSSEFHAWGDSNLYLRKATDDTLSLNVEHRAAPSLPALALELAKPPDAVALKIFDRVTPPIPMPSSVHERITTVLTEIARPLPFPELRAMCGIRSVTVYRCLDALIAAGRVVKSPKGYRLAPRLASHPSPDDPPRRSAHVDFGTN